MSSQFAQSIARALGTTTTLSTESVDVDINIGNDAVVDEDGAIVSPLAPMTDEPIVEAQETDIAEEVNEVEETSDEIDSAEGDVETLESIKIQLEKSLAGDGLDTVSYEMLNIAMDSIYRKYGISAAAVMPSMESFGEDRHGQTEISMEKVKDTLKSVKDGAVEFLKKLWFQIKQLAKNLITLNFSMDKRLTALGKAASDPKLKASAGGKIKLHSAKKLVVDGRLPNKSTIIDYYAQLTNFCQKFGTVMEDYLSSFVRDMDIKTEWEKGGSTKLVDKVSSVVTDFSRLESNLHFQNPKFVKTEFGRGEGKSVVPGIKLVSTPVEGEVSSEVDALTAGEIQTVVKSIKSNIANMKRIAELTNKKEIEKMVLEVAKENADEANSVEMTKQVRKALKDAISVHGKFLSYVSGVNKAMGAYCAQSLDSLKKSGKAEDKKEPEAK